MKEKKRVLIALILSVSIALSGCGVGDVEVVWSLPMSSNTVFQIGDKQCSLPVAQMVLANYKNLYAQNYGEEIWNQERISEGLESYIKEITLAQLAKMKTMCLLAVEQEVSLSEEDIKNVQSAAKAYQESLTKEEIRELGVSYEDIEEFYMEYALATKLYTNLTGGINEEVSDDDARVMEVLQIVVTDEEAAQAVQDKLVEGEEFQVLASYYSTIPETNVLLYWQDLEESKQVALGKLNDGDISETIKVDGTYYIYKCVSKINRDLTEENKKTIVKDRATEAFDDVYEAYESGLTSTYNSEIWESLELDFSKDVVTGSLFAVFETYCGYLKNE